MFLRISKYIICVGIFIFTCENIILAQTAYGNLEGAVTDQNGTFIKNALVTVIKDDITLYGTSDASGYFSIDSIPAKPSGGPTIYTATVENEGYKSPSPQQVQIFKEEITQEDFILYKYGQITGVVDLIPGTWGDIEDVDISLNGGEPINPDPNGNYSFTGLEEGEYEITATLESYQPHTTGIFIDWGEMEEHDIYLQVLEGSITGNVEILDGPGNMENVIVAATLNSNSIEITPNEDRDYIFENMMPGEYVVAAELEGYPNPSFHSFPLDPGGTMNEIDFYLYLIDFSGIVVDQRGTPIQGAAVEISPPGLTEITNENGEFTFSTLNPGDEKTLQISKIDFESFESQVIITSIVEGYEIPSIPSFDPEPGIISFGTLEINEESIKNYLITYKHVDSIKISCEAPYTISLSEEDFSDEIQISPTDIYEAGQKTIYVKFKPTAEGEFPQLISHAYFNVSEPNVKTKSVTGKGEIPEALTVVLDPPGQLFCPGETISLTANTYGGSGPGTYNYLWIKNGDTLFNATGKIISDQITEESEYIVVITDDESSVSDSVAVNVFEKATIKYQPRDTSECEGETITFSVEAEGEMDITYQWQVLYDTAWEDIQGATAPDYEIEELDPILDGRSYRCVVTGCEDMISDEATLKVFETPVVELIIKGDTMHPVLIIPNDNLTYQWYKNDTMISGATGQYYFPQEGYKKGASFHAIVTNINGCTYQTEDWTKPEGDTKCISLYPNPARNKIFLDTGPVSVSNPYVSIKNILGNVSQLINLPGNTGNSILEIDIGSLPKGYYSIELYDERKGRIYVSKVLIY